MRLPLIIANWKMHLTVGEARSYLSKILGDLQKVHNVEIIICPPFTSLLAVNSMLAGTGIGVGAQNMHWDEKGAFTGEISPNMISEFCKYVILGHSERREYFNETNSMINKKVQAALIRNLSPIVCIGESRADHKAGNTASFLIRQLTECFENVDLDLAHSIIVAYEPIWAIGNGLAAHGPDVNQIIGSIIRPTLARLFDVRKAQEIRVLYGGSVTGSNAAEFFSQPDIDGALVGGASLKVDDFVAITRSAVK